MARIINVGYEHKEAFESVCFLLSNASLLGAGYQVNESHTRIIGDSFEYVLSTSASQSASKSFGFDKDGANWFKSLRGGSAEAKDDTSEWLSFKQEVQKAFHKKFSVVEYLPKKKTNKEIDAAKKEAQRLAEMFLTAFYPELKTRPYSIVSQGTSTETDDMYGVAMRVDLASEVTQSAPMPFLCKIFFNSMGNTFKPLPASLAYSLNNNIISIAPEDDGGYRPSENNTKIIDLTLAELERLVDDITNNPNKNFADYACFSDEQDEKSLALLKKQMAHDNFALECQKIDCLYITHIKTEPYICDLLIDEKPMLRFSLGLNNTLSVRCLNCGGKEFLINHNDLTYTVDDKKRSFVLNPEEANFGLTDEDIAEIREFSDIKEHFIEVCGIRNIKAAAGCTRYKCRSQLISIDVGEGVIKSMCKDCPYPEVVWEGKYFTPLLDVATDKLELVADTESLATCKVCRRRFSESFLVHEKCPLCNSLAKCTTDKGAKDRYKAYKGMIPITTRLGSLFAPKACVEDDELMIFVIGKNQYAFNKLNANDKGYLKPPTKVNK